MKVPRSIRGRRSFSERNKMKLTQNQKWIFAIAAICVIVFAGLSVRSFLQREKVLRQVIERLSSDSRIAEAVVTKSELDEASGKIFTTIKFLEYDSKNQPLPPRYFTFHGNIIQFQTLVIRFNDDFVRRGDRLKGKSVYLFMKAFVLDGENTQEFEITPTEKIPAGYRLAEKISKQEASLWRDFWQYALDHDYQKKAGIKNAQIEAPGSLFLPGTIYTLKIEHDGGVRIDTQPIPAILKGEKVAG